MEAFFTPGGGATSPSDIRDDHAWIMPLLRLAGISGDLDLAAMPTNPGKAERTQVVRVSGPDGPIAFGKRILGPQAEARAGREIAAIRAVREVLAPVPDVMSPEVLAVETGDRFLLSAVRGTPTNLAIARDSRDRRDDQIRRIAAAMAALHGAEPPLHMPFGLHDRAARLAERLGRFDTDPDIGWGAEAQRIVAALGRETLERHRALAGTPCRQLWQHGDAAPLNILLDPRHVGLVDFESSCRTWHCVDAAKLLERLSNIQTWEDWHPRPGQPIDPGDLAAFASGYGEDPSASPEFDIHLRFDLLARLLTIAEARGAAPPKLLALAGRFAAT